jgi:hypothetical protein
MAAGGGIGRSRRGDKVGISRTAAAAISGISDPKTIDIITHDDIVEFEESRLVLQSQLAGLFNRQ